MKNNPQDDTPQVPNPDASNPLEPAAPPVATPMPESAPAPNPAQPPQAQELPHVPQVQPVPVVPPTEQQPQAPQAPEVPQYDPQPSDYPTQVLPENMGQPPVAPPPPQAPQYQQFPQSGQQPPMAGQSPIQPGPGGQPPAGSGESKTNVLAIVSLVSAFFFSLLAVILGHISLSQIKKTGEKGRGLALTGTILGYVGLVVGAIVTAVIVIGASIFSTELNDIDWDDPGSADIWEDDDFFADDDLFGDDDELFGDTDYSDPWVGTPHAAFCDALMDIDFETDDPFAKVTANAPDQFKDDFEKGSQAWKIYSDPDSDMDEWEKAGNDWDDFMSGALDSAFDFCFDI